MHEQGPRPSRHPQAAHRSGRRILSIFFAMPNRTISEPTARVVIQALAFVSASSIRAPPAYANGWLKTSRARARRPLRLDQENVSLGAGAGTMLDAAWHDEQVALPQLHGVISELDLKLALEHEEEVVSLRMAVPDELALDLYTSIL
jgi:hypothetical protein